MNEIKGVTWHSKPKTGRRQGKFMINVGPSYVKKRE